MLDSQLPATSSGSWNSTSGQQSSNKPNNPQIPTPSPKNLDSLTREQMAQFAQAMGTNGFREYEAARRLSLKLQKQRTNMPFQLFRPPSARSALSSLAFQPGLLALAVPTALTSCERLPRTGALSSSFPLAGSSEISSVPTNTSTPLASSGRKATSRHAQSSLRKLASSVFAHRTTKENDPQYEGKEKKKEY